MHLRRRSGWNVSRTVPPGVRRRSTLERFWRDERGATMVEYGLMLLLIATVCVAAVATVGQSALTLFQTMPAGL